MDITGTHSDRLIDNQVGQTNNRSIVDLFGHLSAADFGFNRMAHGPQFFRRLVNTAAILVRTFLDRV